VGTGQIVLMVLAAAAPMAAIAGAMPLGVALGTGKGFPGAYVVAAAVLLLFAVGYAAMSKHVTSAGAFYSYVTRGLGRQAGGASAYVALVAYNSMAVALSAALGYFAHNTFASEFSIDLPWAVWWGIGVAIVAILSHRRIELTAATLGIALICEVGILLVFDVAVLINHGFAGFSLEAFAPSAVFGGGAGVALMYAFSSFVGFEATAIYAEEARNPRRTVARATYIALAIIAIFYTLTSWAVLTSYGLDAAQAAAGEEPAGFVFAANAVEVSEFTTDVMQILVVTSLFAGFLAFHQAASRYFFAVARDGLLPAPLQRVHPRSREPYVAGALQLAIVVVAVGLLGLLGDDAYLQITAPILALGTLGIVLLQASASASVVAFFRGRSDGTIWATRVAPSVATAGLLASVFLVCRNFGTLTGSDSGVVKALPWVYLAAALVGFAVTLWLRRRDPAGYAAMAANHGIGAEPDRVGELDPDLAPEIA
jgi:amino acid transporter